MIIIIILISPIVLDFPSITIDITWFESKLDLSPLNKTLDFNLVDEKCD